MKLKDALKKFDFLKRMGLSDKTIVSAANHLACTEKGSTEVYVTPLAKKAIPIHFLVEWDLVMQANEHKMNSVLLELERANRSKFGPRSISVPYSDRRAGLMSSFKDIVHSIKFKFDRGPGTLHPISFLEAVGKLKLTSSSGFPFLVKKSKAIPEVLKDFDALLARKDPCILFTRTTENLKTRNVWGFPIADTILEMMFYDPLLAFQKKKFYRAALISPDATAHGITDMINRAISSGKVLYSVDFAAYDTSVLHQYITAAFEYIKSCFDPSFYSYLDYVCERMYSIGIVTPKGVIRGKHGIPSGSTFTNEVDSIIQLGIALTCSFISEFECQIQGDDGVYMMFADDIAEFEAAFKYAQLKLEKSKSHIASNYVVFCQNLYHKDYEVDGHIGGIYPTYRAINRILFQERFVDLSSVEIESKDYFGIRCLTILENCKYHPLFEELVRFVLTREKFSLDISDDGLEKYCKYLNLRQNTSSSLNHQYGSQVRGIRNFAAYKLVSKILAEEGHLFPMWNVE